MNKPIEVLFDATPLLGNKSGVGIYTENLVRALANEYPDQIRLTGFYFNFLGRKNIAFNIGLPNVNLRPIRFFPGIFLPVLARRFGMQIPLELIVPRRYDIQLFTNFISLPTLRKTPQLLAVHDLGCFDHPEFVQEKNLAYLQRLLPSSIKRARRLITISKFTKERIIHVLHKKPEDILLTPIPPSPKHSTHEPLSQRLLELGIEQYKYILYVGTIEPRKNIEGLIEAVTILHQTSDVGMPLVLAGGKGWKDQAILTKVSSAQATGTSVIITGYISEEEKAELYSNALLFVLPSHYEGFGMPLLEAMSYGIPVAASDIAVFHEVAEDAALYFDKDSPEDIALKIKTIVSDRAVLSRLTTLGIKNLDRFDWKDIAKDVYQEMLACLNK